MSGQPGAASDLAARLRRCRAASGMTQRELAERLGTTRDVVGSIERGLAVPDPAILAAWTWATGCQDQAGELVELARLAVPPVHVEAPDVPLVPPPPPDYRVKPARRWPVGPSGLPVVQVDELA
jgi:DNA-binding XRE family transcriptional regulator